MTGAVQTALRDASHDIENAAWPGLVGAVMNPVRDFVFAPALNAAELVVPKVTNIIPFADPVVGFGIRVSSGVVKTAYGILPHQDSSQTLAVRGVEDDSKATTESFKVFWAPGNLGGLVFSGAGFAVNTALDLVTAKGQKVQDWSKSIDTLKAFLTQTGKTELLREAFLSPRLVRNCIIVSRIQEKLGCGNRKRAQKAAFEHSKNPYKNRLELSALLNDARKYMKYATAAYGVFQDMATASIVTGNTPENTPTDSTRSVKPTTPANHMKHERIQIIEKQLGLSQPLPTRSIGGNGLTNTVGEIIYMTKAGGDSKIVGHFIAINNVEKAVILAVRGTYSISGTFADIEAQSEDFSCGKAHKGIADRSKTLWAQVKPTLDQAFKDHPGYKLVLTGHSLGGGVANLINIIVHDQGYLGPSEVVCYGFASPPTFKTEQPTDAVKQAVAVSHCFITEEDTVPFLSANSIFRLAQTLTDVDEITKQMSLFNCILCSEDASRAPPNLIQVVRNAARDLEANTGYEKLEIPAKAVFWMRKNTESNWNTPVVCHPTLLARLPIYLSQRMILDHFPPQYEESTSFS